MDDDPKQPEREPAPPYRPPPPRPAPPPAPAPPGRGEDGDREIREGGYLPGESDEEY